MLHVYVFKFDQNTAENGLNQSLIDYISGLPSEPGDIINYYPSKKLVVIGVDRSVTDELKEWIMHNTSYKFEIEEHNDKARILIQVDPSYGCALRFYTSYLLPLFTPESYLEI
jgi:hypothetical protein